jgi:hypothetical protein
MLLVGNEREKELKRAVFLLVPSAHALGILTRISTETKSTVSIDSGCANSLTNSYVQNSSESQASDRPGKKEHIPVKDRVMEPNAQMVVRGSIHILSTL